MKAVQMTLIFNGRQEAMDNEKVITIKCTQDVQGFNKKLFTKAKKYEAAQNGSTLEAENNTGTLQTIAKDGLGNWTNDKFFKERFTIVDKE